MSCAQIRYIWRGRKSLRTWIVKLYTIDPDVYLATVAYLFIVVIGLLSEGSVVSLRKTLEPLLYTIKFYWEFDW